jgi:hypothetical protein
MSPRLLEISPSVRGKIELYKALYKGLLLLAVNSLISSAILVDTPFFGRRGMAAQREVHE